MTLWEKLKNIPNCVKSKLDCLHPYPCLLVAIRFIGEELPYHQIGIRDEWVKKSIFRQGSCLMQLWDLYIVHVFSHFILQIFSC